MDREPKDEYDEFSDLVGRMHNNGELPVLVSFLEALKVDCSSRRYSEHVITAPQLLASVSGEEKSYDHVLEFIRNSLLD